MTDLDADVPVHFVKARPAVSTQNESGFEEPRQRRPRRVHDGCRSTPLVPRSVQRSAMKQAAASCSNARLIYACRRHVIRTRRLVLRSRRPPH